jgi:hypothetical protein
MGTMASAILRPGGIAAAAVSSHGAPFWSNYSLPVALDVIAVAEVEPVPNPGGREVRQPMRLRTHRRLSMTGSLLRTFSTCVAALFVSTLLVTAASSTALFF